MKILTTIHKFKNLDLLLKKADGVVVSVAGFSARETAYFSVEELVDIAETVNKKGKEMFISLKAMLFDDNVEKIKNTFLQLKDLMISGFIIADLGYLYLLKELGFENIIYHPETLLASENDFNIMFDYGVKGAFIAKEITLEDLKLIANNKQGEVFILGHGHLNMFYSKRKLLNSYFQTIGKDYDYQGKKTLTLKEQTRKSLYPIIEDEYGTHIFRSEVSTVLKQVENLKDVDYLLIDTIFKDDYYGEQIIDFFKNGYNEKEITKLQEKYNEVWDEGFLFTKTIYKKDEES